MSIISVMKTCRNFGWSMDREDKYSLLLLAGGKSTRMGKNKAELLYAGKTFTELLISKVKRLGIRRIYISGFQEERRDVHIVWDQYPDRGPLGGIHACMKAMDTPFCLVLPVDAPKLPQEVLEELLAYHETCRNGLSKEKEIPLLWEHGDRMEPLIAIYPVDMADAIEELIKDTSAPVFRMLDRWGYECFRREISETKVINVNTPELYEELLREAERE